MEEYSVNPDGLRVKKVQTNQDNLTIDELWEEIIPMQLTKRKTIKKELLPVEEEVQTLNNGVWETIKTNLLKNDNTTLEDLMKALDELKQSIKQPVKAPPEPPEAPLTHPKPKLELAATRQPKRADWLTYILLGAIGILGAYLAYEFLL